MPQAVHHMERVIETFKLMAQQWRVMETLEPQDFLNFRDELGTASGFESFQMREMELVLGVTWQFRPKYGKVDPLDHIRKLAKTSPAGQMAVDRLSEALEEMTLKTAMRTWLHRTPIFGSSPGEKDDPKIVDRFLQEYADAVAEHHQAQAERLLATSLSSREEVMAKYAKNTETARHYLFAEDIPQSERSYVKRYRAGLLFIESYRELPL